jgi:hypothetical protein
VRKKLFIATYTILRVGISWGADMIGRAKVEPLITG